MVEQQDRLVLTANQEKTPKKITIVQNDFSFKMQLGFSKNLEVVDEMKCFGFF